MKKHNVNNVVLILSLKKQCSSHTTITISNQLPNYRAKPSLPSTTKYSDKVIISMHDVNSPIQTKI